MLTGLFLGFQLILFFLFLSQSAEKEGKAFIQLHFIHGSIPLHDCTYKDKRLGGLLGGHVEIQVDSMVYGFIYADRSRLHTWSRKDAEHFNAKITAKNVQAWEVETTFEKITSIHIPVNKATKEAIIKRYQAFLNQPPYDYAFWGHRCTSSAYQILAESGVFPAQPAFIYQSSAFFPRLWRLKVLPWAKKNELNISIQKGIPCRIWE